MMPAVNAFGKFMLDLIHMMGGTAVMFQKAVQEAWRPPYYMRLLADQVYQIGIRSIGLVFATSFSTGMVMALQYGYGLQKFGGKLYIPKLVALSLIKELGPVFTGLMIAARSGAGIASEIGSMKVTQQIDAIRALGTSPIKKIVIPRILATIIAMPLLVAFSDIVGITGGLIVGVTELQMDASFYLQKTFQSLIIFDYMTGIGKGLFFGIAIATSACYFGMNAKDGTRGVGIATTQSVMVSSIVIVISDYFLTKMFWILYLWTR
jgi:phospholipid/cholesterol/gamma-HCH transport system permease protein